MRRLVDLDVSRNQLWRCGAPPPAVDDQPATGEGGGADAGPIVAGPAPVFADFNHALQAVQQQQQHQQLQVQLQQELVDGAAAAAAGPAEEAAPPGEGAAAGPAGNAQGQNGLRASVLVCVSISLQALAYLLNLAAGWLSHPTGVMEAAGCTTLVLPATFCTTTAAGCDGGCCRSETAHCVQTAAERARCPGGAQSWLLLRNAWAVPAACRLHMWLFAGGRRAGLQHQNAASTPG